MKQLTKADIDLIIRKSVMGDIKLKEEDEKKVQTLMRRSATVKDTLSLVTRIVMPYDKVIAGLMDNLAIQSILLEKLGVTDKMIEEAKDKYKEETEKAQKEREKQLKEAFDKAVKKKSSVGEVKQETEKIIEDVKKRKVYDGK